MRTSNAPSGARPVFSTTIAKVIRSAAATPGASWPPASTPVTLLLNVVPRLLEVTDPPLRRGHALPGAETVMPAGTLTVGLKVALGLLAAMMPLRIPSTGSNTCTWTILSAVFVFELVLRSCCAHLVCQE